MNIHWISEKKRHSVFILLLFHLVCSSAKSFSTTNTATTSIERHSRRLGKFLPPSSSTVTSLKMVGSAAPRGGSSSGPFPPSTAISEISRWKSIRNTVFPIHGKQEVSKFLLIGSIKFFIILALTLTRDTKDTLVVTQCGAEAIAFLKVCTRLLPWRLP